MTKRSILTMVVLVAAVALIAPAASAQTTLNIQNGTVVGVWDNTLVIRDSSGVSRQFDVPPDFKVDVDGRSVSIKELRPGMHITAAVRTVNTPVVVQSKELRDATYIKHAGALVYVKEADGIHSYNTPAGFRFWINNAPLRPDDLQTNMKLNATIVHTGTATGTSQELAGASATDEAAKAAAAKAAADRAGGGHERRPRRRRRTGPLPTRRPGRMRKRRRRRRRPTRRRPSRPWRPASRKPRARLRWRAPSAFSASGLGAALTLRRKQR